MLTQLINTRYAITKINRPYKHQVVIIAFLFCLFSLPGNAQTIVSNCNPNGWVRSATSASSVVFHATGPGTPTMPFGSAQFFVSPGVNEGARLMNSSFAGSLLTQVSELNYFSYIQEFGSGALRAEGIYLELIVDYNSDGSADDTLYYQPLYQNLFLTLTYGQWQFWDGLTGLWWSAHGVANATPGVGVKPLSDIIALNPNAKMLQFGLGAGYVTGSWNYFLANADAFKIKVGTLPGMVYNFENQADADNDGICDNVDNCPNIPGNGNAYYKDQDNDSYGNKNSSIVDCSQPLGYVLNSEDCNDFNANIHPGATEICNNVDDDCDGIIDEGAAIYVNAGYDQSVFYAGPGVVVPNYITCATLTSTTSGGTGTFTYSWSNGATTQSITVCPSVSTIYVVTVTDTHGCTSTDDVFVAVTDATCAGPGGGNGGGNGVGNNYILVCKDAQERCIKVKDLQRYLDDGYTFGPCYTGRGGGGSFAQVNPDTDPSSGKFSIDLSRMQCQKVKVIISTNDQVVEERHVRAGFKDDVEFFDLSSRGSGVYYIKIIGENIVYNSKIQVNPK